MAKYIKTRSSGQCRSHHQKMLKKHGSIDNIILSHNLQQEPNEICDDLSEYPEMRNEGEIYFDDLFYGYESMRK